jgi:hypothetical protein
MKGKASLLDGGRTWVILGFYGYRSMEDGGGLMVIVEKEGSETPSEKGERFRSPERSPSEISTLTSSPHTSSMAKRPKQGLKGALQNQKKHESSVLEAEKKEQVCNLPSAFPLFDRFRYRDADRFVASVSVAGL